MLLGRGLVLTTPFPVVERRPLLEMILKVKVDKTKFLTSRLSHPGFLGAGSP